jgi:putative endonuclease
MILSLRGATATKQSIISSEISAQRYFAMNKQYYTGNYYIYLMTNYTNTVIYTGVTNNLIRRVFEHKNKIVEGFSKKYNIDKLVYYEATENAETAICREKQIKGGSRTKKINLIMRNNPEFKDLYQEIIV